MVGRVITRAMSLDMGNVNLLHFRREFDFRFAKRNASRLGGTLERGYVRHGAQLNEDLLNGMTQ